MTQQPKGDVLVDSLNLAFTIQREKFRVEIRKNKIDRCLNGKRFQNLPIDFLGETKALQTENKDLPSFEENPQGFFDFLTQKIKGLPPSHENMENLIKYLSTLRKFSCNAKEDSRVFILNTGIIDSILVFIKPEFASFEILQNEVLWLLRNLMTLDSGILETSLKAEDLVRALIDVLDYSSNKNFEATVWTLVNLAEDSKKFSKLIFEEKIIDKILSCFNYGNPTLQNLKDIFALIRTLCDKEFVDIPKFYDELYKLAVVAKLCVQIQDIEINSHALWIISFLTDTNDSTLRKLLDLFEKNTLKSIVNFTLSSEGSLKRSAIRIACNFLAGDNQFIMELINIGILDKFFILLDSKDPDIRREIYWGLSNILASKLPIITETFEHKIFDRLMNIYQFEDYKNKREIIFCLTNTIIASAAELTGKLIDKGVFDIFYDMVDFSEPKMVLLVLEAIEKILIYGEDATSSDGVNPLFQKIQSSNIPKLLLDLQLHPSQQIFETVGYIIQKYFESEVVQI